MKITPVTVGTTPVLLLPLDTSSLQSVTNIGHTEIELIDSASKGVGNGRVLHPGETFTIYSGTADNLYGVAAAPTHVICVSQAGAGTYNPQTPALSSVSLTSGTAVQDATGTKSKWTIPITGGTAGTVGVAIGPTSGVANTVIAVVAANAVASQQLTVDLPANWWIKVTTSVATIAGAATVLTYS